VALPGAIEIERAGLQCWPGIEVEWDGRWVRRAANGHTQRANSTQCFDPADDADIAKRVAASRAWHEARGLQPIFRINPLAAPALVQHLDDTGWRPVDHSKVVAMGLGEVAADPRGEVLALDDPAFLDAQVQLRDYDDATLAKLRGILAMIEVPACGIVLRGDDGRAVSSALMAISGGIVITGNVVTDARERRKGYGAAMMRTGHAWAKSMGATVAALNVAADNTAGLALYHGLGYRPQYDYVYRIAGAA
jgi:GNAT superfamily N-acetyltransferase